MIRDERGQVIPLVAAACLLIIAVSVGILFVELTYAARARNQGVADVLALSAGVSLSHEAGAAKEAGLLMSARNLVLEAAYKRAAAQTRESDTTGSEFFRMPFVWERLTAKAVEVMDDTEAHRSGAMSATAKETANMLAGRYYPEHRARIAVLGSPQGGRMATRLEELRSRLRSYETRISIIRERLDAATRTGTFEDFKLFRSSLGGLTAARNRVARLIAGYERSQPRPDGDDAAAVVLVMAASDEGQGARPALAAAEVVETAADDGAPPDGSSIFEGELNVRVDAEALAWLRDALELVSGGTPASREMAELRPYLSTEGNGGVVTRRSEFTPALVSTLRARELGGQGIVDAWLSGLR